MVKGAFWEAVVKSVKHGQQHVLIFQFDEDKMDSLFWDDRCSGWRPLCVFWCILSVCIYNRIINFYWHFLSDAIFCLQLQASCLQVSFYLLGSFFAYNLSFYLQVELKFCLQLSCVAYSGKVCLRSSSRDCKQRSLTVSQKAPTVKKNAPFLSWESEIERDRERERERENRISWCRRLGRNRRRLHYEMISCCCADG